MYMFAKRIALSLLLLTNTLAFTMDYVRSLRDYISKKTFFTSYVYQHAVRNSKANQENPIVMENPLPDVTEIANRMHNALGNNTQFLWGASTAEHQCSMQCNEKICSYSRYAQAQEFSRTKRRNEHGHLEAL